MTKRETEALLVLAPGVYIRAGVHCPHCRRLMRAESERHPGCTVIDWTYVCRCCGTVMDAKMKIVRSSWVWRQTGEITFVISESKW